MTPLEVIDAGINFGVHVPNRLPLLEDFLSKLPKFLGFKFEGYCRSDFEEMLLQRQFDEMSEGVGSNVPLENFPLGTRRPFGTWSSRDTSM